jgi:hypothetical protein
VTTPASTISAAHGSLAGARVASTASGATVSAPPRRGRAPVAQPVRAQDQSAGAHRGDTPRIEPAQEREHAGIPDLHCPARASADNCHIAGRRIGEPILSDDGQAAGKRDRTRLARDGDRRDRRQNARGHRDDADGSAHVDRLDTVIQDNAEAGGFVRFAPC